MLWSCIRDCKPTNATLMRMNTAYATVKDWAQLRKTCMALVHIGHLCREMAGQVAIVDQVSIGRPVIKEPNAIGCLARIIKLMWIATL